ncbi:MAG: hypothetical protein KY451_05080 [Actinobacteria bacterium]|nr:hypothetical protein [Actinomycetota bacterium]MBW3646494.1 hypothetical protein [Actinomycetota bacterium]
MTPSGLSSLTDRIHPDDVAASVGGLSLALGGLAVVAPRRTASMFGLRAGGPAVPLLVRMVGVRNAMAGVRTLQADDSDRGRALQAGLVLGAVDATAVLLAARQGVLSKRAAAGALTLLAAIAVLGVAAGRD